MNPMTPELQAAIAHRMTLIPCFYQPEVYTMVIDGKQYSVKVVVTITEIEVEE